MARRARSDSISAQLAAVAQARSGGRIEWPDTVTRLPDPADAARADHVFRNTLDSRAAADWLSVQVTTAAEYSNLTAIVDRTMQRLEVEGWMISSPKNPDQRIRNPLADILATVGQRQLSLARQLSVSSISAAGVDARTVAKNTKGAARARDIVSTSAQSLLAGYDDEFSIGPSHSRS